jgi:hypothetical protein
MRTLYLRNVPDEMVERLDRLAARAGLPVSVFAVRELAEASRRADNATLLDSLPDLDVPTEVILAALAAERALGCPLLTADRRLAAAPGPACAIQLMPR